MARRLDSRLTVDQGAVEAWIERLRTMLGIDRWLVCGASWGVTLAVAQLLAAGREAHDATASAIAGRAGSVAERPNRAIGAPSERDPGRAALSADRDANDADDRRPPRAGGAV